MGGGDHFHAFQGLDAALGLTGLGGLGAKAVDEFLHMGDFPLLFLIGRLLLGEQFGAAPLEGGVVAGKERHLLLFNTHNVARHLIQKVTVM